MIKLVRINQDLYFQSMVMKTQLEMFNSAVIAYFSGNGDKLSEVSFICFNLISEQN